MASRDKVDVEIFHKSIQYALEKLGKSKSGFERTVVSKFKRKRRVGSGNELVDYSRAPCLGADQKARGLWGRDWVVYYHSKTLTSPPAHAVRRAQSYVCARPSLLRCPSWWITWNGRSPWLRSWLLFWLYPNHTSPYRRTVQKILLSLPVLASAPYLRRRG